MAIRIKQSYNFAFRTSLLLTLALTVVFALVIWYFKVLETYLAALLIFFFFCLAISFAIIQLRVQKLIYRRIKKVYDDVSLLESTPFPPQPITTDMKSLTAEIERFAQDKKIEIDTLKIREEYRKDFLGNISHELKTPLFTVQGYILTLLDGAIEDKAVRKKYLQRANKGVERLIYIIRDLDLITKLEYEELNLDRSDFDIIDLIQSVFDLFEMKAAKNKISLIFDMDYKEPIMVNADQEKIQQVLSNLVVNSIKYGLKGGTTEVSVENLIRNKVIVRITDNGEGIEEVHVPRIFERFYRIDKSGSRKEGGSGLGLSIVKHIIEAHDEKIYVESVPGVGSEFSFTLERASS